MLTRQLLVNDFFVCDEGQFMQEVYFNLKMSLFVHVFVHIFRFNKFEFLKNLSLFMTNVTLGKINTFCVKTLV